MKGINKVILVGLVGKDPEVRYSQAGTAIATFSLATKDQYKDKRTGEKIEKTSWHNCVAFGKNGELAGEYVRKGAKLYIDGSLDYQDYEKDGVKKTITKITVRNFVMLNSFEGNNTNYTNENKNTNYNKQQHNNPIQADDDGLPWT